MTPAQLVATAAAVVPGLEGRLVAPEGATVPWHAAEAEELAPLHRCWAGRHPEAGPHYWGLRGWGLLVWQPIYLGVIATHLGDGCPRLDAVSQALHSGDVDGYQLADHALATGDEDTRLVRCAASLAAGCDRLLSAWTKVARVHPKAARRTCADCVLAALLAVHRHGVAWCEDDVTGRAQSWLAAMGLEGESGYLRYRLPTGEEALALDRKVCCLHFRRQGAEPCATCPRRPMAERIECLLAPS